ncbi:MAG: DNA topoisomerase I [Candidatus Micrarchaeia archaeon]
METVMIITEKPRVAEKMAAALAEGPVKQSAGAGVKSYELARGGKRILIAPAVGHVYSLKQKEAGGRYPVFDIEWVPASESSESAAFTKKYLESIKKLAKNADSVVNACDWDIEGSLIGGNIIRYAVKKPAKRMLFSTLTKEDLVDAYSELKPLDTPQIDAGEARHYLDWYWGINTSRALMSAIKKAGIFRIMSIGRVQGPALAILSQRELEIQKFVPEPYWTITAVLKGVEFSCQEGNIFDEKKAKEIAGKVAKAVKDKALVEKVEEKEFAQNPPFPFDLTSMEIEAYRAFGFKPSMTLSLAQDLYEAALISYPRTSSQKLSSKLNLKKIITDIGKNPVYADLSAKLISKNKTVPREGEKDDAAHPAIHPTGLVPSGLNPYQAKLYDLIVRRFLSCFADPAKRARMNVAAKIGEVGFAAGGSRTVERGWFEFYGKYVDLEEEVLPKFEVGERVPVDKHELEKKMTKPPKRYTEASLVKKLEDEDLGTKATRSEIVETLFRRGYVSGKSIEVSALGLSVYETLTKHADEILSEQLTRDFEKEMEDIQSGKITKEKVIAEGRVALEKILEKFRSKEESIGKELVDAVKQTQKEESVLGPCNVCAKEGRTGQLQIRKSRFGLFVGCGAYPACRNLYPLPKMALIKNAQKICPECGTPIVTVIRRGKKPFNMCLDTKCKTKESWGKKSYTVNNSDGTVTENKSVVVAQGAADAQDAPVKKPAAIAKAKAATAPTNYTSTAAVTPAAKAARKPASKKPSAKATAKKKA